MIFDPQRTRVIIFCHPEGDVKLATVMWLAARGLLDSVIGYNVSPYIRARNLCFQELVFPVLNNYDHFFFIDNDVVLGPRSQAWLEPEEDIVSCQCDMGDLKWGYSEPDSFHSGCWRAKADVFRKLKLPYFKYEYNDTCTDMVCDCQHFRMKALAAGFSISHAGFAEHKGKGSYHG